MSNKKKEVNSGDIESITFNHPTLGKGHLKPVNIGDLDSGNLVIKSSNKFFADFIRENCEITDEGNEFLNKLEDSDELVKITLSK